MVSIRYQPDDSPATPVVRTGQARVPTRHGTFKAVSYRDALGLEYIAFVAGDPAASVAEGGALPLVRVHSECLTGDVFGSTRCDCGTQLDRAMEVAAAGSHNVLLTGPPGTGKTLIAKSLPSILPRMDIDESLEATKVYSVAGMLPADTPLIRNRPFRSPHHTVSYAGLVGGGAWPRPGEVSLAHRGVLFLDELPEFGTKLIEVLRQP